MGGTYFDDEQEIGPQGLTLLRKVLADLFRDQADVSGASEELGLAKELVALFKSGFRSEEELRAMIQRSPYASTTSFADSADGSNVTIRKMPEEGLLGRPRLLLSRR